VTSTETVHKAFFNNLGQCHRSLWWNYSNHKLGCHVSWRNQWTLNPSFL